MRVVTFAIVVCLATLGACRIDRATEGLECSVTADCASLPDNRICSDGYCIVPNCPAGCTTCDETAMTCTVECSSVDECNGTFTCPSGWSCSVVCDGSDACNDISCGNGSRCDVHCLGLGACDDVRCSDACQCDVECAAGACSSMECPKTGGGQNQVECTAGGVEGASCDSSHASGCTKC